MSRLKKDMYLAWSPLDIAKAYDTTFRPHILHKLYNTYTRNKLTFGTYFTHI